jgi:hypothetical protein
MTGHDIALAIPHAAKNKGKLAIGVGSRNGFIHDLRLDCSYIHYNNDQHHSWQAVAMTNSGAFA